MDGPALSDSQRKTTEDAKSLVISMLEDNMRALEKMEEERLHRVQEHEEEKQRLEEQMEHIVDEWLEQKAQLEDSMAIEKGQLKREMEALRAQCEQEVAREKEDMQRKMAEFRTQCAQKMREEEERLNRKTAELRAESERRLAEEKATSDRLLAETRRHTEEQLRTERQLTDSIMNVLRELPPLQTAMELGDLGLLEEELGKWQLDALPERFGDSKGVVAAVVKLAQERQITWRGVEHTWKDVLRQVANAPGSDRALTQQCQRLFRAIKEAQLTKMDIRRSDPQAIDRICEVFFTWQERTMNCPNHVQRAIVRKVANWPQLGPFDFADLDICLRLVDRGGLGSDAFLSRALALVEDEATAPKEFRPMLSHIEMMLFFLKYAASEDLAMTHQEFSKQPADLDPAIKSCLSWAERMYPPGTELVRLPEGHGPIESHNVDKVLEEMRKPSSGTGLDNLGPFREIFYQWALAMRSKFNLLVLPHHTQVVCLLVFQRFLEAERIAVTPKALIAQVGTGEGKSMIIAALALYVVVVLRKKVHVVVDDEALLERDFWTYKRLFDAFEVPSANPAPKGHGRRPLRAVLCTSEDRTASEGSGCVKPRVDPDADICYCEARHAQSFYASIARSEMPDFTSYKERVLILDEVDALVIDEEPNEAFVYPNRELSDMATIVAGALMSGVKPQDKPELRNSTHPATRRVVKEMTREWTQAEQLNNGEDYTYSKELGRYCALHSGRVNPTAWSLALECMNFREGFSKKIHFQERLFVMSRPRVFRKYHQIMGLSGSIGSTPERTFLKETYRAAFFEVPPFLKTCHGSPFHEPVPVPLGPQRRPVYIEASQEAQVTRVAEVALEARERVPVLVIARDRLQADQLVEGLRSAARSRGLGSASDDIVHSLSRTLLEADPEQWKENLNRATLAVGENREGAKSWRITVTDPRGARGTDYRMNDPDVDAQGGLLLVPTIVPTSQRDWIQFLGRTARQDRRGQFCAVLCSGDYETLSKKYNEKLPSGTALEAVHTILGWGDRQVADRIKASAALYNCGVRMNELCEELFSCQAALLQNAEPRERLVDACQRYRWMSVREVDAAFSQLPGLNPSSVCTEACDLGRPNEPPAPSRPPTGQSCLGQPQVAGLPAVPKVVIFALDWSASMRSRDTNTPFTRFETCLKCVIQVLQQQVHDADLVGIVCFGPKVDTIVLPTAKGVGAAKITQKIRTLKPQTTGGTAFYDAVAQCLQMMHQPGLVQAEALKWLVCLTDGDDLGSKQSNAKGELVDAMLDSGISSALNMVMITVGSLKAVNMAIIDRWVQRISSAGGVGCHVPAKDAGAIAKAFEVVAECLAAEVGGATVC